MKKLISLFLIAGILTGCSANLIPNNSTVIFKRDLYSLIFEWAAYREVAIVSYAKLHDVPRKQAEEKINTIVRDVKKEKFEGWYESQIRKELSK